MQTLLKNQESCVINGGNTTKYFKLERGTRQRDPISAYLFILVLEVVFMLMKQNKNIKGLNLLAILTTVNAGDLRSIKSSRLTFNSKSFLLSVDGCGKNIGSPG